jgi:hypothetical protein
MSKRLVLVAAIAGAAVTTPLAAQSELGVKTGLSFGDISNKGLLPGSLDTRNGVAGGLFFGARSGVVGFGLEGLYAQRGLQSDQSLALSRTRLDYIDVPLYLKLSAPTSGLRPFVYAGPQVSFEVKCERANGASCEPDTDRKKTNYAGIIGAGIRLGGSLGLGLEGRYVYGLTDLKLATLTSSDSFKHRTFMILLSVGN